MIGILVRRARTALIAVTALLTGLSCGEQRATDPDSPSAARPGSGSNLIECPSTETTFATALVGPLGGIVQVGATSISIPGGALAIPTTIKVTIPASRYMEIDVTAVGFTSFLFNQDVTVTIDYSRCARADIDQQTLHVWHIDPETKKLLEDMNATDDKAARRITFKTGHLSGYAVAN